MGLLDEVLDEVLVEVLVVFTDRLAPVPLSTAPVMQQWLHDSVPKVQAYAT
jgi:hypothetical protein